jgi:hypothetical protein
MTVLNWENGTQGFHTRTRGAERSQLDMILAEKEAVGRIKLRILEKVNLGSDYCVLELAITTRANYKERDQHKGTYKYHWKETDREKYWQALQQPLSSWTKNWKLSTQTGNSTVTKHEMSKQKEKRPQK